MGSSIMRMRASRPQGFGDLDHLPLGYAEALHRRVSVHPYFCSLQQLPRILTHLAPVQDPEAPRLTAEKNILGDGELRNEVELLIDSGDAQVLGVHGGVDLHLLTVHQDLALVRLVGRPESILMSVLLPAPFSPNST